MGSVQWYIYKATEGDRWDTLAYELYHDGAMMNTLMMDNPHLSISATIPAGADIYVRDMENEVEVQPNQTILPPWRT